MTDVLCVECNSYRCGPHFKADADYGMTLANAMRADPAFYAASLPASTQEGDD